MEIPYYGYMIVRNEEIYDRLQISAKGTAERNGNPFSFPPILPAYFGYAERPRDIFLGWTF